MPRIPADDSIDSSNTTDGNGSSDSETTSEDVRQRREEELTGSEEYSTSSEEASSIPSGLAPPGQVDGSDSASSSGNASSDSGGTSGIPDDLNQNRRASNNSSSGSTGNTSSGSGSQSASSEPELPDGRQVPTPADGGGSDSSSDSGSGNASSDSGSDVDVEVVSATTSAQGIEEDSGQASQQARQLEQQTIENNPGITSPDQVRIVRDGDQLRSELTTEGLEAVRSQQEQEIKQQVAENNPGVGSNDVIVERSGDSVNVSLTEEGRAEASGLDVVNPQGGRRQIQEQSVEQRVADEAGNAVETSEVTAEASGDTVAVSVDPEGGITAQADRQGGRLDIQEESLANAVAAQAGDAVSAGEVDVDISGGDASISINESAPTVAQQGGGRRQLQESQIEQRAAEQSEQFSASDFEATVTDSGGTVSLSDATRADLIRDEVASEQEGVSESDVTVSFDGNNNASVGLTQDARREAAREQVAEQRAGVSAEDVQVTFGDDGEVTGASVEENFDDGNRFLGIKGAEDDVERVVQGVGEFTGGIGRGAGQVVGGAAQIGANLTGLSPDGQNEIYDFSADVGERVGASLNVTQAFTAADELGEFIGESAARAVRGDANTIGPDAAESATRITDPIKQDFADNPARATAGIVGSIAVTGGLFKAAQGTRAGGVARATLQPGEEAFAAATGVRAGTAARGALSRASSAAPDINVRSFSSANRGQLTTGRLRSDSESETETEAETETETETDSDLGVPDDPFLVSDKRVFDPQRQFGDPEDIARSTDDPVSRGNSENDIGGGISGQGSPETATGVSRFEENFNQAIRSESETESVNDTDLRGGLPQLDEIRRQTPEADARTEAGLSPRRQATLGLEGAAAGGTRSALTAAAQRQEVTVQEDVLTGSVEDTSLRNAQEAASASTSAALRPEVSAGVEETARGGARFRAGAGTESLSGTDSAIDSAGAEPLGFDSQTRTISESESASESRAESEAEIESAIESATETAVETESTVETEVETRAESAAESEARVAVETESNSESEFEILDFASEQDGRPFGTRQDSGDEQRFNFGDVDLL